MNVSLDDQVLSNAQTPKDCYKKGFIRLDKRMKKFDPTWNQLKLIRKLINQQILLRRKSWLTWF